MAKFRKLPRGRRTHTAPWKLRRSTTTAISVTTTAIPGLRLKPTKPTTVPVLDLPAVALCRHRCSFVDEAIHRRYALAEAHAAYIHSLKGLGLCLQRFFNGDIDSSTAAPHSPVLNLPPKKKCDHDQSGSPAPVLTATARLSSSNSGSHLKFNSDSEDETESQSVHHHLNDTTIMHPYGESQVLMADRKITDTGLNMEKRESKIYPRVTIPSVRNFVMQLPQKLQNSMKSHFKGLTKNKDRTKSATSNGGDDNESSTQLEINLEKQMQAWKENPTWVDQSPEIKVSVPKGSFCHLNVNVDVGLPPDAVYNIVIDPDNKRVFKNIKEVLSRKVLVDDGLHQVVEVEQAALWKFLWWSGTISVHVLVDQNRADYSMKFKQVKTGFMERFEGSSKVEPLLVDEKSCLVKPKTVAYYMTCTNGKGRVGSKVSLEQIIQPAIVPPPPISWYLRGITTRTTEMLITDLLAEAARIRGVSTSASDISEREQKEELAISEKASDADNDRGIFEIKERWVMRRRIVKPGDRRLK